MEEMTTDKSFRAVTEEEKKRMQDMADMVRYMDNAAEKWAAEMYCPASGGACKTSKCWAFGGVTQTLWGHVTVSCRQYGEKIYNEAEMPEWF